MAFTNKGVKWELKNSAFLIFSIFPLINSICFFHMNGNVPNKKWKNSGWIFLLINIFLILAFFISAAISNSWTLKYGHDLLGFAIGCVLAFFLMNIIVFFYLISQRADYLKALEKKSNKNDIMNKYENFNAMNNNSIETKKNIESNTQNNVLEKVDINTASEEQLSNILGLTIIDAKKAISYREEHNGYESIDEFFSVIGAKPHIVAKIQDKLVVSKKSNVQNSIPKNTRRIDL